MKRSLLLALLLLAGAFNLYSLDRNAFTITSYRLNVQIDRATPRVGSHLWPPGAAQRFEGSAEKRLAADFLVAGMERHRHRRRSARLQLLRSTRSASCNGSASPTPPTSTIPAVVSEAIVTLEKPVPPGGSVAIDVQYGGKITPDSTRLTRMGLPEALALHSDWDQISEPFTAVRGLGYVVWYPVSIEAVSMSDGNAVSDAIALWQGASSQQRVLRLSGSARLRSSLRRRVSLPMPRSAKGYWTVWAAGDQRSQRSARRQRAGAAATTARHHARGPRPAEHHACVRDVFDLR